MRKIIFILFIFLLTLILVFYVGCSNSNKVQKSINLENDKNSQNIYLLSDTLENNISRNLKFKKVDVKDLKILSVYKANKSKIVIYSFVNKSHLFEGYCEIFSKSKSQSIIFVNNYSQINSKKMFSVNQIGGSSSDIHNKFFFVGGIVNNKTISSIIIKLQSKKLINVIIGDNKVYGYIKENNDRVISIVGVDKELKVITEWSSKDNGEVY